MTSLQMSWVSINSPRTQSRGNYTVVSTVNLGHLFWMCISTEKEHDQERVSTRSLFHTVIFILIDFKLCFSFDAIILNSAEVINLQQGVSAKIVKWYFKLEQLGIERPAFNNLAASKADDH